MMSSEAAVSGEGPSPSLSALSCMGTRPSAATAATEIAMTAVPSDRTRAFPPPPPPEDEAVLCSGDASVVIESRASIELSIAPVGVVGTVL